MRDVSSTRKTRIPFGNCLTALIAAAFVLSAGNLSVRAQQDSGTAAVVDGRRITLEEVDASVVSQLFPLQQQIHAIRVRALENLILKAILEGEAKRRGISVETLRRQLTADQVEVSASEVERIYLENAPALAAMSTDEARERIRLDLESQARMRNYREALAKLKEAASIQPFLREPKLRLLQDDRSPSIGPTTAPVSITEFTDYECQFCKESQNTLKRILREYKGNVRLTLKNLPLIDIHPRALPAARAAFCAGEQGAFWQYHDALFASENLSAESLNNAAARLDLNLPTFTSCLESEASHAAVITDVQEARRIGVNVTPTFIINGKLTSGVMGFEQFKGIIERELKAAGAFPPRVNLNLTK